MLGRTGTGLAQTGGSCGLTGTTWSCTWSGADASGTFTVPTGISSLTVDLVSQAGAKGDDGLNISGNADNICFNIPGSAGGSAGKAAEVKGSITVTPGATLTVVAGSTTHALHGGSGGTANFENAHDPDNCPPDPIYIKGGNGGAGGGASFISAVVGASTSYLAVAGGGGGGGGGGANPYFCSPGSTGGDHDAGGQGEINFHCTGDVVVNNGGNVGANSDGSGGAGGSYPSFAAPLSGGGGGGGGGITGGGGGAVGTIDGGAGGAGGQSKTPSGGTLTTVSGTPTPKVVISYTDSSAPTASIGLSGTQNNGWYTTAVGVNVGFADPDNGGPVVNDTADGRCTLDPASAPATFSSLPFGCSLTSVGTNGVHTIYAGGKDFAGNTGSVSSASFKIDRTAPTSSPSLSPSSPNGSNGWYTSTVSPSYSSSDNAGGSGWASEECSLTLQNEFSTFPYPCLQAVTGEGFWTYAVRGKDAAGNTESFKDVSFKIDGTAPTDAPLLGGTTGDNGWWRSDVSVAWNWTDPKSSLGDTLSGVDSNNCQTGGTSSGEGTSVTVNGSCHDMAGNTGSDSKSFKVDKTKPTISVAAQPASPNGNNGWYTSNVTAHFTCGDNLSGLAGSCPSDQTLSTEGSSVSSTAQTVSDNAGWTSDSSGVITVKLDKTAPSVAVTGVNDGAQYTYGNVPAAGCTTSDSLSGVATPATVTVTGGTNGAGTFTATCSGGTDDAGNLAAPVFVTYTVMYGFGGFISPVPKGTVAYRPGTTTPVTFNLTNAQGQAINPTIASTLSGKLTVKLTGQGITPVTATCTWNFLVGSFKCPLTIPTLSQIGLTTPYQITAYENLNGTPTLAPPWSPFPQYANPETVYFK
jgi:hypothetical protein